MDFDFLGDFEFNPIAVIIVLAVLLAELYLFFGIESMKSFPLVTRIIAVVVSVPFGYVMAMRMIEN